MDQRLVETRYFNVGETIPSGWKIIGADGYGVTAILLENVTVNPVRTLRKKMYKYKYKYTTRAPHWQVSDWTILHPEGFRSLHGLGPAQLELIDSKIEEEQIPDNS